jgi:hypothetical protein
MKLSTILALLILFARAAPAQQQVITPESHPTTATLHQWLHSSDPRLIAWAADFAQRTHNATILAEMPAVLENWPGPTSHDLSDLDSQSVMAMAGVLDSLIQENSKVPPSAIRAIASQQPAAAAVLASRLPLSESVALLSEWATEEPEDARGQGLVRVASMLLAKNPQATRETWPRDRLGFVAGIVAASEEQLKITVASAADFGGGAYGGSCGDSFGQTTDPSWPKVHGYALGEGNLQPGDITVVDLDGDYIGARRYEWFGGFGQCNFVQKVDASTRHQLIAYWLGGPSSAMTWQPNVAQTIIWTTQSAYDHERADLVQVEQQKLHDTVEALYQRGLLTNEEAATVAPKLTVTVECQIDPCPLPPGEYQASSQ